MKYLWILILGVFTACSGSRATTTTAPANPKMDRMTDRQANLGQSTESSEKALEKEALMKEIETRKQAKSEAIHRDHKPAPTH